MFLFFLSGKWKQRIFVVSPFGAKNPKDEGLQYWFLASGESSWMDPSEEARRARKVRAALFGALLHESRSSSRSSQSLSSVEVTWLKFW